MGMGDLEGVGDLTGDHVPDLMAVERSTEKLWLYPGTTNGPLRPRTLIGSGGWNAMRYLTATGDVNGDGAPDFAAAEKATGRLWLYQGAVNGQHGARTQIGSSGWNGMRDLTMRGSITGDANPDLLAVENSSGKLFAYPGAAGGQLGARVLVGGGWND